MNDEKEILPQVHELQVIVNKLCVVKIDLPVPFQVGAIIVKLPSSWNGYRKKLLHNSEDYSFEQLMKYLQIEEESKVHEKLENVSIGSSSRAHDVDKPKKSKKTRKNALGPKKDQDKLKNSNKNKPNVGCFVCGKSGQFARDCRHTMAKRTKSMQPIPTTTTSLPP